MPSESLELKSHKISYYVSKKYISHKNNNKVNNLGVYSVKSFDEYCDLTNYDRSYNIMFNDYDENNVIDLASIDISDDFIDYLNEYNTDIVNKGARMYYSFSPMNKEAIINSKDEINDFYLELRNKLNFPIISNFFFL